MAKKSVPIKENVLIMGALIMSWDSNWYGSNFDHRQKSQIQSLDLSFYYYNFYFRWFLKSSKR